MIERGKGHPKKVASFALNSSFCHPLGAIRTRKLGVIRTLPFLRERDQRDTREDADLSWEGQPTLPGKCAEHKFQ